MIRPHLAAVALVLLASMTAWADPVRVPGTRASLQPPAGFVRAERFPGFQNAELQASIVVTEVPAPAQEMMRAMTREGLASKGMTLLGSTRERAGERDALLLHVAQSASGIDFLKWMLVTGDAKATLMVVGTFPKSLESQAGEAIRAAVLSSTWADSGATDAFEGLPFRLTPAPRLRLAGRMGNMVMLTESGNVVAADPAEALYIAGVSVGEGRVADLRAFSEARAAQTAKVRDVRNFAGRPVKVAGLSGWELLADARDAKTGAPLRLYQVIAPDGSGYLIIQALVGAARAPELVPEFRKVTASLAR